MNYSSLLDIPLLLAWKFHGLWLLVDIGCFKKARTNYHLILENAMKNNLMSYLAGDFGYVMQKNVGLHFRIKKVRMIKKREVDSKNREELWNLRIEEAYFTNTSGHKVSKLPNGLWPLFISAEPESKNRVEENHVNQSFIIPENPSLILAHTALPVLINFYQQDNDKIHWRKQLEEHKFPVNFKIFYNAAKKGIEVGFVKYVYTYIPNVIPSFLEDLENND